MRKLLRIAVVVVVLGGLMAAGPAAMAAGQRPETFTEHQDDYTDTFTDEFFCIGGVEQEAVISIVEDGVFHGTFFEDGRLHVTGTFVGQFIADPVDPALPTYTGRYTVWFGENQNKNIDNGTFTFHANGSAPDGSKVAFGEVHHITAGSIDWVDDEPVLTDVRSEVSLHRCK